MDSLFSGERDAHNTTVPLFIHNCSNTLDLESPPKKKPLTLLKQKSRDNIRSQGRSVPPKPKHKQLWAVATLRCFVTRTLQLACYIGGRNDSWRERGKQCRVRPTRKGHKSVDLAWPLTGFQARFATGFCSSSGREQEWEVLERSGVSYKMRYCSEWRF